MYNYPLLVKFGIVESMKKRKSKPVEDRFWSYVSKSEVGCWNWTGHKSEKGYGLLSVHGRPVRAHRISWLLHHRQLSHADQVLHHCDNPSCVRPDHLFLGDNATNHADKVSKNRQGAARGEAGGSARLTVADVIEIRSSTERRLALARRYSISISHLDKIRSRKKWQHVP